MSTQMLWQSTLHKAALACAVLLLDLLRSLSLPFTHEKAGSMFERGPSSESRHGDPNHVVSASRNPVSVPSPTQAM